MYNQVATKLFYYPLEAILFDVPSYQLSDVAEIYWAMRDRNKNIFDYTITQGKHHNTQATEGLTDKDRQGVRLDLDGS